MLHTRTTSEIQKSGWRQIAQMKAKSGLLESAKKDARRQKAAAEIRENSEEQKKHVRLYSHREIDWLIDWLIKFIRPW